MAAHLRWLSEGASISIFERSGYWVNAMCPSPTALCPIPGIDREGQDASAIESWIAAKHPQKVVACGGGFLVAWTCAWWKQWIKSWLP
ncbi:unnamed protein product [Effrenium voratum]|nr:unnamed protein product [Effrenium voratum]